MKPKLKPPGTKRLKLDCEILLSSVTFIFKLRRYHPANALYQVFCASEAGSYTRPPLSST